MIKDINELEIIDEVGNTFNLEIISHLSDSVNNKNYVIYTDNLHDDKGNLNIFISEIVQEGEYYKLIKVTDYSYIASFIQEVKDYMDYLEEKENASK